MIVIKPIGGRIREEMFERLHADNADRGRLTRLGLETVKAGECVKPEERAAL